MKCATSESTADRIQIPVHRLRRPKEVSGITESSGQNWIKDNRTLNIIFGISELFWDSAQNLTLQTAIVRCRRHGKSSTYLSQGCNITDGRTGMGDDPATGQKKLLSHPSAATSEPLFSQALLAEQRTSNGSSPGTDPAWS